MGQFDTSTTLMYTLGGILNQCRKCKNPTIYALLLYMWDNFKPLQDEWIMKGILTEMNTGFMHFVIFIWDNFKPLQDE